MIESHKAVPPAEEKKSVRELFEAFIHASARKFDTPVQEIKWCHTDNFVNRKVYAIFSEDVNDRTSVLTTGSRKHDDLWNYWQKLPENCVAIGYAVGHVNFTNDKPDPEVGKIKLGFNLSSVKVEKDGTLVPRTTSANDKHAFERVRKWAEFQNRQLDISS